MDKTTLEAPGEVDLPLTRRRLLVLLEVCCATAAMALAIAAIQWTSSRLAVIAPWSSALVAGAFLGLPLAIGGVRRLRGDVLGVGTASIWKATRVGLVVTLIIAVPFIVGYDLWQVRVLQNARGQGPGLLSYGLQYQAQDIDRHGRVVVAEKGVGLEIDNGLAEGVEVVGPCAAVAASQAGREGVVVAPGGRLLVDAIDARSLTIRDGTGGLISEESLVAAGSGEPLPQPIEAERDWPWLLWMLLTQVVVVALPEEAFFRGYVQGRLRAVLTPRRRILGVDFGLAHVVSALLFALIHLVAVPSASRLLVFFPGLLFAWLAERSRSVIAPTVHHALCNAMMQAASRLYG